MGSSAGGIIALAISTDIPDYELEKICFTMKDIPLKDRYKYTEGNRSISFDDFGREITT